MKIYETVDERGRIKSIKYTTESQTGVYQTHTYSYLYGRYLYDTDGCSSGLGLPDCNYKGMLEEMVNKNDNKQVDNKEAR